MYRIAMEWHIPHMSFQRGPIENNKTAQNGLKRIVGYVEGHYVHPTQINFICIDFFMLFQIKHVARHISLANLVNINRFQDGRYEKMP